ncbi:cell division protein FtsX [Methylobacterium variabile]|jgi:cell division transport system permease protein|uniref:Cell division protein FtsX n=1 Tax=Methylobacterium variabile TaxID=298794 RepID=A0A0J6S968_9HYPH|nr:cell division protein FtsX [Methylobacterium variabile]KMO29923.1 cell division protein FtsX [Methylobacterium variabile]
MSEGATLERAPRATPAADLPPTLRRNAPLVPTDTSAGRALAAVIAILTFLAALCAGGAEIVASSAAQWQGSVAQEVTIQVRPGPGRDTDADVATAAALAAATPGVAATRPFSKGESERLLEPWLGSGLDLGDLPVPRLITVRLGSGTPDLGSLRQRLAEALPGVASLDDHALWLSRLSTMANTVVGVGIAVVALVLLATGLAVTFATRGAMAGNREVVEVLHFVGADADFIAREFQRRFFRLGLRGGGIGAAAALGVIGLGGALARLWRAGPAGDEIEALFGGFAIGWRGYASVVLIGVIASVVTAVVSRLTVRRFLD